MNPLKDLDPETVALLEKINAPDLAVLGELEKVRFLQRSMKETQTRIELKTQLMGGNSIPTEDPNHPGSWLLAQGWKYTGPTTEEEMDKALRSTDTHDVYCWEDPHAPPGSRQWHTLTAATALAFQHFYRRKPRGDFISDDDE